MLKAILISAIVLNLGLLLGRLSGFVREAFVAASFGASFEADIVVLMLTVPDLMVSLLMGGAMGAILVPAFSQNQADARKLLYQSAIIFGFLFSILAAAFYWQIQTLVTVLVPGFDSTEIVIAAAAVRDVIWLIPLTVLAGTTTAYLHFQNKFIAPSLGTLIVNSTIIVGLYQVYNYSATLQTLALFVLVGGLLRFTSQLSIVRPGFRPLKSFRPLLLRKPIIVQYCQAMLSGSLLFLFPIVARAMASFEQTGSVALLNYSIRLIEFPLAICISFLSVVLFPRLAQSFSTNPDQHRQYIRYGVQATLALALVATITLSILGYEYASFVYGYGDMTESNVETVALLLSTGLLVLPLQGLSIYVTAVFNSRGDTRTPMIVNGLGLIFFLGMLNTGLFGTGLMAIMWGLVSSFALIGCLQLLLLKIEDFSWAAVYLDKSFLSGGIIAIGLSIIVSQWIVDLPLSGWFKLFLGFVTAFVCLIIMALFYPEIRRLLKASLGDNDD